MPITGRTLKGTKRFALWTATQTGTRHKANHLSANVIRPQPKTMSKSANIRTEVKISGTICPENHGRLEPNTSAIAAMGVTHGLAMLKTAFATSRIRIATNADCAITIGQGERRPAELENRRRGCGRGPGVVVKLCGGKSSARRPSWQGDRRP